MKKVIRQGFTRIGMIFAMTVMILSICLLAGNLKAYAAEEYYKIDGSYWGFDKATGTITWIPYEWEGGTIPAEIEDVKVVALGDWACSNNDEGKRDHLKEVTLPEGLKKLGDGVFSKCRIESLVVPDSVETIGDYAFRGCLELRRISLPEGIKKIGESCFRDDEKLEYLSIGDREINYLSELEKLGIKTGDYAFRNCYVLGKDFSPSYKTGKWYKALHEVKPDAGETGDYVSDMLNIAESQKGYHEGNSFDEQHGNNTKGSKDYAEYNYWWGEPGTKWCGEFAGWVIAMASVPEEIFSSKYYADEDHTYAWKNTAYAGGKYSIKKGDVIYFLYDGGNHVVMVESVSVNGNTVTIRTIEGNNSNGVNNDIYEINAKTGKTTNCWTDINGHVEEIYGPDWDKLKDVRFYTVKFDANGGKTGTKSKKLSNGAYYGVLPIPTYSGHEFDGWYTEKEGGSKITSYRRADLDGNITLYAHWSGNGGQTSGDGDKTDTVTVSADKSKVKYSKLKKKAQTVKITVKGSTAGVRFENVSKSSLKDGLTVSDDGKVTFAKGAKKGTYKIKVTFTDSTGKKTSKTLKIKVK